MPQSPNLHDAEAAPPPQPLASWYTQSTSDGLGDRLLMFDNSAAPSLELLRFGPALAQVPGFETALREQVHRLAQFRHPAFARVRSVQRLEPDDDLALISNYTPGKRLSEVLHRARGPALAAALIRQLAPALALFHQQNAGLSLGVLSPDRIVVSPEGRLTIVEHVVGPAIDTLDLRIDQLSSIGIALPPARAGATPRLEAATDWYQLGLVAVSVLMGRPVTASDLPRLETLLDQLSDSAAPDGTPLSPFIRQWLDRALQISGNRIESGADARAALDEMLQQDQPRDPGRVVPLRQAQTVPSVPIQTSRAEPFADTTREGTAPQAGVHAFPREPISNSDPKLESTSSAPVAEPSPAVETFTRRSTGQTDSRPRAVPFSPVEPAPVRPPAREESISGTRAATEVRQRPPRPRVLSEQDLSPFEREVLAGRAGFPNLRVAAAVDARTAAAPDRPHAGKSRTISISVAAALVLLVVLEAGVITWLGRALWLAPQPAMVVETDASGENVVVSNRPAEPAPLRLAVAPDLRWVRVTSPGVAGGKGVNTAAGAIRISSPIALEVLEGSRVLGSVPGADLGVPAGRHDIELVNAALGYRLQHTVEVEGGQTVSVHIAPAPGWVKVEASPGTEVSIDGRAVGRTPLAPLQLALGEHHVTLKYPAGSSERQRVTVKSEATTEVIGKRRF